MAEENNKKKEVATVPITEIANPYDYVLIIQEGKLKKIKVSNLKKYIK